MALSADGRRIAISSGLQTASTNTSNSAWQTRVYDPINLVAFTPSLDETNQVREVHFSPDGRWLLTLGTRPIAKWIKGFVAVDSGRLWDANTGQPVSPPFQGYVNRVIFTRDNRHLFVVRAGADPMVWDLTTRCLMDPDQWQGLRFGDPALSSDGERAAVTSGTELRLYDARTGDPLAPPLSDGSEYRFAKLAFSSQAELLTVAAEERAQLWLLPKDTRPVEDLVAIAELLAGRRLGASGRFVELPAAEARRSWEILEARYTVTFTATPSQERTWRERTVAASENAQQWFAALFHLDQLVAAYPGDEALRLRRARARNQAAMEELRNTSGSP